MWAKRGEKTGPKLTVPELMYFFFLHFFLGFETWRGKKRMNERGGLFPFY